MDFPELLGQVMRSFSDVGTIRTDLHHRFVRECMQFLRLSSAQVKAVISKCGKGEEESTRSVLMNELPQAFLMYLLSDEYIKASLLKTVTPDIQFLRKYRRQFLQDYFNDLFGKNLKQRLQEKVHDIKPPLSFSEGSQVCGPTIVDFLRDEVVFVMPGNTKSDCDTRIPIQIRLYHQDSKYDHPLLANDDLRMLHKFASEQFSGIAREPFVEAICSFMPQDIYGNEACLEMPPDSETNNPEEVMTALCPDNLRPTEPGLHNLAKEQADLYWGWLRTEDRFVISGRVLERSDAETKAWARLHGYHAVRFSDRRAALERQLSMHLNGLSEPERSKVLTLLIEQCHIFQNTYPLEPES